MMADRREVAARSPGAANGTASPGPAAERERVLLLECRLEQVQSALEATRHEADHARTKLAEALAREAEHARGASLLHDELAEAREEIAALHRHLARSEALRAEAEGRLFEAGARDDAEELIRLRRRVLSEGQRAQAGERALERLRARVEELLASREALFTRVAEWQQLVREDGPEAADLSEFLAELRREILDLEYRGSEGEAREAQLRERLVKAGIDPDEDPAEHPAEEAASEGPDPAEPETAAVAEPPSVPEAAPGAVPTAREEPSVPEAPSVAEPSDTPRPAPARNRTDALIAELLSTEVPTLRSDLLLRLGRSGDPEALDTIRLWTESSDPSLRATAYEAIGRLLERVPTELEPFLRKGLGDPDARVRRRVALAAATARGLGVRHLLRPLEEDPDAQVRRLVREVLRRTPAAGPTSEAGAEGGDKERSRGPRGRVHAPSSESTG